MALRTKLYLSSFLLHSIIVVLLWSTHEALNQKLFIVTPIVLLSYLAFHRLISKIVQPLEYLETFSRLLNEKEFTVRFNNIGQKDLDRLIDQFNQMLAKLYQERLKLGEQRGVFQQLMLESPVGVLLLDYASAVTDLNPAAEQLLKAPRDAVIDKRLTEVSVGNIDHLHGIEPGANELVTTGDGQRLKIGHFRIFDRGAPRSFFTISEMTGDVIQAQKSAYGKLIRFMSHEVNNTIAITDSLLESSLHFSSQLADGEKQEFEKAINIVRKRSATLGNFMQAYADVIMLPAPHIAKFNCTVLIENLVTLFFAESKKRNIKIDTSLDEDVFVEGDVNLIEQALVNVLKNAMEAIKDGGVVSIKLAATDSFVHLSIEDDGIGLDKSTKENLFTPFFTTKSSGQGVGLMIVQEIMRSHGYEYSLKSGQRGGAIFSIAMQPNQSSVDARPS